MVQKKTENLNPFWQRVVIAFKTDDVQSIADKLGISYNAVRKWKNDQALPSKKRLEEISGETGRSIDWLLTGKENLTDEEREATKLDTLSLKFGAMTPAKKAKLETLIDVLEREIERLENEPD